MKTRELAGFVERFTIGDVTEKSTEAALIGMMDVLCVALAGSREPTAQQVCASVLPGYVQEGASLIGRDGLAAAQDAAFCNGTLAHFLDYDDMLRPMIGHPSAVLIPALLALLEVEDGSGEALLQSYVLGLEVSARLGIAVALPLYRLGWHPTSVIGAVAAACAASKAVGLNAAGISNAIGIAVSLSSGLRGNFGSPTKGVHAGNAARNGVLAAYLSRAGLSANSEILEGPMGFYELYGNGSTGGDDEREEDRPEELIFDKYGLDLKLYPCCGRIQPPVLGILRLRDLLGIDPRSVQRIECTVHPVALKTLRFRTPQNAFEARYSLSYCLATAMVDGCLELGHFTSDSVHRQEIREYIERIQLCGDPTLESEDFPVRIRIVLQNSAVHSVKARRMKAGGVEIDCEGAKDVLLPRWTDLIGGKWKDCAVPVISRQGLEKLEEIVRRVPTLKTVRDLGRLLRTQSPDFMANVE
jgi:2-methylcitrate dehydratase PrpD